MNRQTGALAGASLVIIGVATLIDQHIKTGVPSSVALILIASLFLVRGIYRREIGFVIAGSLLAGTGSGLLGMIEILKQAPLLKGIGVLLFCFGSGWFLITLFSLLRLPWVAWWALVPGSVIASVGACLLFSQLRLVDFVLYIPTGLSLSFLIWGGNRHLAGLIIPGCILLSAGVGIYVAWGADHELNSLSRTGMMLIWFALGWAFITLFFRISFNHFIWWPLIPAGILLMVGLGLYLGGNPGGSAVRFLGNTGSIGLLIFGLYLLLMRSGIRR